MKIVSKTDFTSSLNLPRPTITIASDLVKREKFFLEKIQDPRKYKEIINRNVKGEGNRYRITELPINIVDKLDSSSVFNQIFKDILIRHQTLSGNIVDHELIFTSKRNAQEKSQEETEEPPKVEENKGGFLARKNKNKRGVQQSKNSLELMRLREANKKRLEENVNKQIIEINNLGTIINYNTNNITESSTKFHDITLDTFFQLYQEEKIKNDTRPVHWCTKCKEALDKEDIFYEEETKPNHFVLYQVDPTNTFFANYRNLDHTYFVASTIHPWAILSAEQLALTKETSYSLIEFKERNVTKHFIIASEFVENVMQLGFIVKYQEKATFTSEELKQVGLISPIDPEKKVKVITASSKKVVVDPKSSSGIRVVSAGNTYLDYLILKEARHVKQIRNITDKAGKLNTIFGQYASKTYAEANDSIVEALKKDGNYFEADTVKVKVPKCRECKEATIYREVNQWYLSKKSNDEKVRKDLESVIPKLVASKRYKTKEILDMIEKIDNIKELMISDDRVVGTPIPTFYCASCGRQILTEKSIELIKKLLHEKGIEEWHKLTPEEILQGQVSCECGGVFFFKDDSTINDLFTSISTTLSQNLQEKDVINYSIDSKKKFYHKLLAYSFSSQRKKYIDQVSQYMVHAEVDESSTVADINLDEKKEDKVPDKKTLKQIGIIEAVRKYGTDVLRLWVAESSIDNTVQLNEHTIAYIRKKYLDIRRTFKFMLSNLYDFNPIKDKVPLMERNDLDKIVYKKLTILHRRVNKAYEELRFNDVFKDLQIFCESLLCDKFFESNKYNLYILNKNNPKRRSVQSTMYDALMTLIVLYEPILPFTLEEIWPYVWHKNAQEEQNLLLYRLQLAKLEEKFEEEEKRWHTIFYIRDKVRAHIIRAQQAKVFKNPIEAKVIINTKEKQKEFIDQNFDQLKHALNVSDMEVNVTEKGSIKAIKAPGVACARCTNYSVNIGMDLKYRYLCPNCAHIMHKIE